MPIIFGIVVSLINVKKERKGNAGIDFAHLSERAMLYVVFTFGEMVIAIAEYFDGELNFNSIYFSLMTFLIVVGLFLSYGTFYDKIIDREQENNGLFYMLLHIFIIFAQNSFTSSLEFMRDGNMKLLPKEAFLIGSLLIFFVFLFLTRRYSKTVCRPTAKFYMQMILIAISFVVLMIIFRDNMRVNITISAGYIWIVYSVIYWMSRKERHVSS